MLLCVLVYGLCCEKMSFSKAVFVVGHMHNDIEVLFGRWNMKLHEENFPTIPLLRKSHMHLDYVPVIPHTIEK